MKNYKKKTLALVLASVITVAGSFAEENYKNSLMGLEFKSTASGINMVLQTKTAYTGNIEPRKTDAETYVLILPEVNSSGSTPSLSSVDNNIKSVNVRTMPYSSGSKGYTKVTIKTFGNTNLTTSNTIYVPSKQTKQPKIETSRQEEISKNNEQEEAEKKKRAELERRRQEALEQSRQQKRVSPPPPPPKQPQNYEQAQQAINKQQESVPSAETGMSGSIPQQDNSMQSYIVILWVFIILAAAFLLFKIAKENIANATGESFNIDLDEDESNNKKKKTAQKKKSIKKTIRNLDSKYSNNSMLAGINKRNQQLMPEKTVKPAEELNVVDLDALFQEHVMQQEQTAENSEENDALEDFLNEFSFSNEEETSDKETPTFDEEFLEKLLQDKNIKFLPQDIECIKNLLNLEIYDETIRNIEQYAVSNPIKENKVPQEKLLENIVSDYAISQNILFSQDDISILKKLMSVEIDKDFITNLKTDPQKTKEMESEINKTTESKIYKPSEILTLNVRDMLPNLSDELKAHGNKKIESKYKPDTVYFSEGYEVSTLSVDDMPDLTIEINRKDAFASKPSASYQLSDLSYDVSTLSTSDSLPDLKDVMANPDKYEEPKKEVYKADENEMLNNLLNATFKPFDDGTRDYEILNKPEDFNNFQEDEVSAVWDFSESSNNEPENQSIEPKIEFIQEEDSTEQHEDLKSEDNITEPVYEIKTEQKQINASDKESEEFIPQKLNRIVPKRNAAKKSAKSDILIQKIKEARFERKMNKSLSEKTGSESQKEQNKNTVTPSITVTKCIIDGVNYNIVSSVELKEHYGCHLAKSADGFSVIAYKDDFFYVIKEYKSVKNETIKARYTKKNEDGTLRYLIRVGSNKFIADIKNDRIEYVMDLC